jgi:hypothetical protein
MKFNLKPEEKIAAYHFTRSEIEKNLFLRLTIAGFNPDEFNEETFVPDSDSTVQNDIYLLIAKIKELSAKIEEIESQQ